MQVKRSDVYQWYKASFDDLLENLKTGSIFEERHGPIAFEGTITSSVEIGRAASGTDSHLEVRFFATVIYKGRVMTDVEYVLSKRLYSTAPSIYLPALYVSERA